MSKPVNGAEVDAIKSELDLGHSVTVTFSVSGPTGASALFGGLARVVGRDDVTIRVSQQKALADRGYPERLLKLGMENEDPVYSVMLANPEIDYQGAIRLAHPDK